MISTTNVLSALVDGFENQDTVESVAQAFYENGLIKAPSTLGSSDLRSFVVKEFSVDPVDNDPVENVVKGLKAGRLNLASRRKSLEKKTTILFSTSLITLGIAITLVVIGAFSEGGILTSISSLIPGFLNALVFRFYQSEDKKIESLNEDMGELHRTEDHFSTVGALSNKMQKQLASKAFIKTLRKRIKIFLASSQELKKERQAIELFIGKENRKLHDNLMFLDLVIWEDLMHSFHGRRIQDYFNEQMLSCQIVIFLFFKRLGDYTDEEFNVAYQHFKKGELPNYLYVYMKSPESQADEVDEGIISLKERISEAEQLYNSFATKEDLILQLRNQLDLIVFETE